MASSNLSSWNGGPWNTIMLHGGEIVLDVAGDSRKELQVEDLIAMFRRIRGQTLDDDALLIG